MDEIEKFFVVNAPCSERRRIVFDAFKIWVTLVRSLAPSAILWVDGGFATYKNVPPNDIDVAALIKPSEMNGWDESQQRVFESLLTGNHPDGTRFQPMGGLIDGFVAVRGDVGQTAVWHDAWSSIYINGVRQVGESKGYLEVKLTNG